ncbi:hypothetical protein ACLESD_34440 [Pyxidicoccus sp. 3LFB2]
MNHPLASLVGPLRYACQRDFATLATVKGLRPMLERVLATASGVDAQALEHLRTALPYVDDPAPERRKAALRRVVAGLKLSGVELPVELEGASARGQGALKAARRGRARGVARLGRRARWPGRAPRRPRACSPWTMRAAR